MSTPYIPPKDADFANWSANFAATIAANPSFFGLVTADATAITAADAAFQTAYALAINPATRTSVTVNAKDVQKASTLIVERTYAQIIQKNAGVSDANKAAAGLTVPKTSRTPIPAPGTAPILGYVGSTPGVTTLNYKDTSTPTTKGKPFGALQLELWYDIPPVDATTHVQGTPELANAIFAGLFTKAPLAFAPPGGNTGKTMGLWGRWTTRRGLTGPWSAELDVIVT